jgi:hypothetical protein
MHIRMYVYMSKHSDIFIHKYVFIYTYIGSMGSRSQSTNDVMSKDIDRNAELKFKIPAGRYMHIYAYLYMFMSTETLV